MMKDLSASVVGVVPERKNRSSFEVHAAIVGKCDGLPGSTDSFFYRGDSASLQIQSISSCVMEIITVLPCDRASKTGTSDW